MGIYYNKCRFSACFLTPSNSRGLKLGLYSVSHIPRNSIVSRFCIQFAITPLGSIGFFCLTMSVMQIKSTPSFVIVLIRTSLTAISLFLLISKHVLRLCTKISEKTRFCKFLQCLQGFGNVEIITKPFYVCRMDILISFRGAQESWLHWQSPRLAGGIRPAAGAGGRVMAGL